MDLSTWIYRHGSIERGNTWKRITESLNALEHPIFKVDNRAVRDRYKLQIKLSDIIGSCNLMPFPTMIFGCWCSFGALVLRLNVWALFPLHA